MKTTHQARLVLVTAPDIKVARKLAQAALKARLVACANLVPQIESHYWWKDKLEVSAEVLILFKTTRSKLQKLEACVLKSHPYETPEFVVLNLTGGSRDYLDWLGRSVA